MNFMIYQKLIIVSFLKIILITSSIFLAIIFIMNIFEEITFSEILILEYINLFY